jgi:hypothetical protein
LRAKKKAEILQATGSRGAVYTDRLTAIDAFSPAPIGNGGKAQDWEAITRAYSQLDYIGYAYRCVEEEVRYWNFFQ